MIACIEETAVPVCMFGLLYALPNTQLTRRLATEGRLFPNLYTEEQATSGIGDQCTAGLNFSTARARREILMDYKKVLQHIYSPAAYFGRVRRMTLTLDRPVLNRGSSAKPPMRLGSIPLRDLGLLWRLVWRIALRQPKALWHFAGAFVACARRNPRSLEYVGITAALYIHLGPFSRFVMTSLKKQIGQIDAGEWRSPLGDTPRAINAARVPAGASV